MFKKKSLNDRQILVIVRLLNASKFFLVFLALLGQVANLVPWSAFRVNAITVDEQGDTSTELINYPSTTDSNFDYSEVELLGEMNTLRTDNSKTFQRVDGSYVVSIYNDAVHYKKDDVYESIDNSLSYDIASDEYFNKENAFSIKLPKKLDENKKIKLVLDEYSIDWQVLYINKSTIDIEKNDAKSNNMKELINISQKIIYNNIMTNVDLEYIINGNNVKENIILDKYIENFEMTFEYSLKNLILIQEDGQVLFVNEDGEKIFNFSDLYALDNEGNETNLVDIFILNIKKDVYQISLTIDDEWLKEASFPVVIDPTINSSTQSISIFDTDVSEAYPTTNYSSVSYMRVSNTSSTSEYQGLMYFYLPDQVMDKQITYSTLRLSRSSGTYGRTIGLYKNNANFTAGSVTWNTKPTSSTTMTD